MSIQDENDIDSKLFALIYDWNDESNSNYTHETQNLEPIHKRKGQAIATKLTERKDKIASFARLVVAFAPQKGHAPTLSNIERVEILAVDEHHVAISAMVCDDIECVTILVPIPFSKQCCSSCHDLEDCVLNNIDELDLQAQEILRRTEQSMHQRSIADEEEEDGHNLSYIDNNSDASSPSWWVHAGTTAMQEECKMLKQLMNERNFQKDVNALARMGLESLDGGHMITVLNATVADVGPAGFYLRAKAKKITGEGSSIIDVPLSFSGGHVADNPADLRSNTSKTLNDAIHFY